MPLFNTSLTDFFFNPWFILSLSFWLIVVILVYLLRNKKGATYLFFPLLAMFKTKKLNNFIKKVANKAPKFWKIFWTVGIFISFSFTIYALYFFFTNFINLVVDPRIEQAVIPLIPGVTIDLPLFFYLILPILFVMSTHELAHGIAANIDGVDVKSTGFLGAGLFYIIGIGAFVEIDERDLNSKKFQKNTRLRIASAGTFINGITAGITFILIMSFPLIISPSYRQVTQVNTVLPEDQGGFNFGNLLRNDAILAIKKKGTSDVNFVYVDELKGITLNSILNNKTGLKCSVGDNLTLKIYNPTFDLFSEKNVTLGPRYNIGILKKYLNNGTGLVITKIFSESEGGNNFDKNLTVGMIIDEINGVPINVSNGNSLEKILASFNLANINFSSASGNGTLDLETIGVLIGIYTNSYFMYKNDIAKFFTSFFPDFILRELSWLFLIAFSITLFNMLPLPIFDGDRLVKELINWGVGEDYKSIRKKKDIFLLKDEEKSYELSEYRVQKISSIKIILEEESKYINSSNIILAEEKYELVDKIGDGFKDSVILNLPEQTKLTEGTKLEISYDYWYDEKRKVKKTILNSLRAVTLFIIAGNLILSITKFGRFFF
ncbi:hypothetical protein LCGC14_0385460 [marine sediment metagenome]|uniref:Peptidase M50 domain-containing protein n=1 Tax=marine sediment metagenome TaxID=412755 RepID=A0A0F9T0Y9_9ZZZZ|nr:MAG: Peptidase family M50 [Candidatus Lokiarchaeum sp. GC14_75]